MTVLTTWRKNAFTAGLYTLALEAAALLVAGTRERSWMYDKSFLEGSIWIYGGIALSALTLGLLLCGRTWWVALLEIFALIELYLWFSWLEFAVMVR